MQGPPANTQVSAPSSWDSLLQEALQAAQDQVSRLTWRGARGGVLPYGYDPNSIAIDAILDLLKNHPTQNGSPPAGPNLSRELRRRVWRQVDRLHHLKENFVTINQPDLAPILLDDGESDPSIDSFPGPSLTPLEHLIQKEDDARFQLYQAQLKARLGRHHRLKRLFDFLCAGISKPKDLARRLKIRLTAVASLKKRLRRYLTRFPPPNLRTN